ncbi:hypothetical protein ABC639_14320 [Lacticaseibacillus paracasei]|uniref:Uncharacterized protein n=2 Tax=Lacticaseibacillus paracasei TaxID=1597 RepID=A0A806LK99_LACPA|nr:hypothetical protein [Lacticaseibacillus paracasei]AHJ34259.1 hypothetical protein AF91_14315 [Lacticaseibacillus paracasei N1115]ALX90341.1 hypothetical protein AWC33_11600 [Lacticaseibacillus paracasei]EPC16940.1 hypothetical protein Lpp122_2316 [Lacticaseibacillus paracasei subsp. paracasei Lpp122]MBA4475177.1 hypothetical protein [Lacticaseibacillus paracasei]MCT3335298.1 hypothetical protein [Lacticaseibacillus paracasei]
MGKKIWINIFWGLLVVSFWLYQLFWPLFWNPISKFYGMVALYSIAAIAFGFAVRATVKRYGRQKA